MPSPLRRQSLVEQTASHLREGFLSGRWTGHLPGVLQLAEDLVVSKHILRSALNILTAEGCLEDCGAGKRRKILSGRNSTGGRRILKVAILLNKPLNDENSHSIRTLLGIRQALEAAGHVCIFTDKYLIKIGENLSRLSRLVSEVQADAWIVYLAPRKVMEWFAGQPKPVFALGGRFQSLPVACGATSMAPAIESAVKALVDQGHRRITMLVPTIYRQPNRVASLDHYLDLLKERGIEVSDFHLPHFDETPDSLERCLDSLFQITPPTALLVLETDHCVAILSFLARHGLQTPRDVSLVFMADDPVFALTLPRLAEFHWPKTEHIRNIARWVEGVAKGRPNKRQTILSTKFIPGDTIGPAVR